METSRKMSEDLIKKEFLFDVFPKDPNSKKNNSRICYSRDQLLQERPKFVNETSRDFLLGSTSIPKWENLNRDLHNKIHKVKEVNHCNFVERLGILRRIVLKNKLLKIPLDFPQLKAI